MRVSVNDVDVTLMDFDSIIELIRTSIFPKKLIFLPADPMTRADPIAMFENVNNSPSSNEQFNNNDQVIYIHLERLILFYFHI